MLTNPLPVIQNLINLGGPVVAVLLLLSFVSLAVIIYKAVQFALARTGAKAKSIASLSRGDIGDIVLQTRALKSRLERRELDLKSAEDAIASLANAQIHRLQTGFRLLDSIAQIAPLIGLFGTVLGMITAFQALQAAGKSVDPSILAGGIWVALLTTAVGLAVAVPTSLALTYFESRVARHRFAIEQIVTTILNPAAGEAYHQPQADQYRRQPTQNLASDAA